MEEIFRKADDWEHMQIEEAAKKLVREKAILAVAFCLLVFGVYAIIGLPIFVMMFTAGARALPSIIMLLLTLGATGDLVFQAYLKYKAVQKKEYEITKGTLVNKVNPVARYDFIKRRGVVRYQGGEMNVPISKVQSLTIDTGEKVFLVRMNINHFGYRDTFMICKAS